MPYSNIQFLRKAELIVGQKIDGTNGPIEPINARVFRTRINFKIEQDDSSNANKAKIIVYNLSQESRTFLEQKNLVCFLMVGYESVGMSILFFGDIDEKNGIHVERKGPDIITTIEAGDAEKALSEANIQIGLAKGATNLQIINAAAEKLKVSASYKTDIKKITFQSGFSYSGSVKSLMNDMAKQAEFNWSIQNGELLIVGPAETDKQEAILISPETGLIGYPAKTQDKVIFKSLLNPKIRPGRAIKLVSKIFLKDVSANIKTEKTSFEGDTHEGKWEVKIEGKIL